MKVIYNSKLFRMFMPKRFSAITIGPLVLTRLSSFTARRRAHEYRHTQQWLWFLYVLFPVAYFTGWAIAGFSYRNNWFERDARRYTNRKLRVQ